MIPKDNEIKKPFLEVISDGKSYHMKEVIEKLASYYKLTREEREEEVKSGGKKFDYRVWFARLDLLLACLIEVPQRGFVRITQRGLEVLKENPPIIDYKYLTKFEEYRQYLEKLKQASKERKQNAENLDLETELETLPPEEAIDKYAQKLETALKAELLKGS